MVVNFDTILLFGDATTTPPSHHFQGVKTNVRKNETTFVERMHQELDTLGAFDLQERLDVTRLLLRTWNNSMNG
jgi:hypothetical protein